MEKAMPRQVEKPVIARMSSKLPAAISRVGIPWTTTQRRYYSVGRTLKNIIRTLQDEDTDGGPAHLQDVLHNVFVIEEVFMVSKEVLETLDGSSHHSVSRGSFDS